jgi:Fur family ferric uptake transcriptional regulator
VRAISPDRLAKRIARAGGCPTDVRKRMFAILLGAEHALSHTEIEELARARGGTLDRVILYRVLEWLVSKGLAHKIAGGDAPGSATQLHKHGRRC